MPKYHLLAKYRSFLQALWKIHTHPVYYHHIFSPLICMILHEAKKSRALQFLSAGVNTLQPLPLSFNNQKLWVQHKKQLPEDSEKWTKKVNCGGEPKLRVVTKWGWTSQVIFFSFSLEQDTILLCPGAGHHHRVPEKATDQSVQQPEQLNLQMKLCLLGQRNLEKDPWRPEY